MAVLKKIKASTLMETMVATVLIVIIFMVSSLVLNALFGVQVNGNLQPLKNHLHQLEYHYQHHNISLPFYEVWNEWEIMLELTPKTRAVAIKANKRNDPGAEPLHYTFYHAETP